MIYIATHKKFENPCLDGYEPLHVGAEGKQDLGYIADNTGMNISKKNPNFCELTGLYWIWKNTDDEYKGLVHYRRYFGKSNLSNKISDIYTYNEMVSFLHKKDVVLPYIEYFKQNAKDEILIECCTPEIFNKLEIIVKEKHPRYSVTFDEYFSNNQSTLFNMLFCRKEIFNSYCEWLFSILFELEQQIDLEPLNSYQKRLFGFLSERLLNVWIKNNKLKTINVSIINTEMRMRDLLVLAARRFYHRI